MKFIANTADLSIFLGIPIKKPQPIKSISSDTRAIKKSGWSVTGLISSIGIPSYIFETLS